MRNLAGISQSRLRKMVRAKRLVRRTEDPMTYRVKGTMGDYDHLIVLTGAGEVVCTSPECLAGEHGWLCWAGRRVMNPTRIAREVRRYRGRA